MAEQSKQALIESKRFKEIFTEITEGSTFYPAEEYHQNYYKKKPIGYKFYRYNCGRDKRLEKLWGKSKVSCRGPCSSDFYPLSHHSIEHASQAQSAYNCRVVREFFSVERIYASSARTFRSRVLDS